MSYHKLNMREDFPSLKDIWTNRKNPEMVGKFIMLFNGIGGTFLIFTIAEGNKYDGTLIGQTAAVLLSIVSALSLYFRILCRVKWWSYISWGFLQLIMWSIILKLFLGRPHF